MPRKTRIINGRILTPNGFISGMLVIENQSILSIEEKEINKHSSDLIVDAKGGWILPGLIDLHLHGGMGYDFMDDDPQAFQRIAKFHAQHGTTSFLAATISASEEDILKALARLNNYMKAVHSNDVAKMLGVHLEGPYLNPTLRGFHQLEFLARPSIEQINRFLTAANKNIRLITMAPELPGIYEIIKELNEKRIICSIGHSNATCQEVNQAISVGLSYATHTFNAMGSFSHREPSTVGAVLTNPEIIAEIIADGVHVHPAAVKLLYLAKGTDKIVLITDSSPINGTNNKEVQWFGQKVAVNDGACRLLDGTLAGSTLTMWQAVKNMVDFTGALWDEAIKMASLNPARILGIEEKKGSLEPGKDADIIIINQELQIVSTIVEGQIIYHMENRTYDEKVIELL